MLIQQRIESNKELEVKGKSKAILSIHGRLYIDCLVQSISRNQKHLSREIGENSGNMRFFNGVLKGAIDNAIHKHMGKYGVTGGFVIHIYSYHIKYFNNDVKVKIVKKQDFKVIETRPYKRIIKKEKRIKVKPHIRNGKKIKGYTRTIIKYEEQEVKGYQRKIPLGKTKKKAKIFYKDKLVIEESFTFKKVSSLNQELEEINKVKRKAFITDKI